MQDGRSDMTTHVCKELQINNTVINEPMTINLQGEKIPDRFLPRARLAWRILLGRTDILAKGAFVMDCQFIGCGHPQKPGLEIN